MKTHVSVYERVTEKIVEQLEQGVAPWTKPWEAGGQPDIPHNATSQRRYSGVNVLLLWGENLEKGYRSAAWLTFNQAKELGGHVKKGEHGTHIVYASTFTREGVNSDNGAITEERIPFLKFYTVFNIEQTEGLPDRMYRLLESKPLVEAIGDVEAFLKEVGATVQHGGDHAFYAPSLDVIRIPDPGSFESSGHYYATSLHEHAHWTGHKQRLNRDLSGRFGSDAYAAEELVAELSSAFLCASLGIPGKLRHAEYLGSWLKILKGDKRAIFTAANKATEAAHYLEGLVDPQKEIPPEPEEGSS